ncbi:PTS glucitol/sorbitol transporter subunit IIA [Lonepinella sp. BR2882]|uniref:PTS glucitol/sorbitol transporter subunit IIA n=1 Tax=Lonepinella sp. BR2882 TaxID=3095283 RepID=UPI003F6DACFC
MTILYQGNIIQIGEFAPEALNEQMLITFKQDVPADLAEYCFVLQHDELLDDLAVGDVVELGGIDYPITAVGEIASFNFKQLGHISWRFNGATEPEYPGTVHLQGATPQTVTLGTELVIKRL